MKGSEARKSAWHPLMSRKRGPEAKHCDDWQSPPRKTPRTGRALPHPNQIPRVLPVLVGQEGVGFSGGAGATGTADTVHVVLNAVGEVVVNDLHRVCVTTLEHGSKTMGCKFSMRAADKNTQGA